MVSVRIPFCLHCFMLLSFEPYYDMKNCCGLFRPAAVDDSKYGIPDYFIIAALMALVSLESVLILYSI